MPAPSMQIWPCHLLHKKNIKQLWFCTVLYELVWSSLVWSGLAWFGLVWPGLVWPGLPGLGSKYKGLLM